MSHRRGRPAGPPTGNIRVTLELSEIIHELARLDRTSAAVVCDRLLLRPLERELTAAKKRELERLTAAVSK